MEISLVIMTEAHQLSSDLGTGLMVSRCASSDQPGVPLGVMNAAGYVPLGNNVVGFLFYMFLPVCW